MRCSNCGSQDMVKSRLQRGFGQKNSFAFEPDKRHWTRKGIRPEVYVCRQCRHVMFFVSERNFANLYIDNRD
ncbi:MAG: hypothetical protein ACOZBH_05175 [Patescibacteria group bacterium]